MTTTVNLDQIAREVNQRLARPTWRVMVCDGTGCVASGSRLVHRRFLDLTEGLDGLAEVQLAAGDLCRPLVSRTGCHGLCQMGPLVVIPGDGDGREEIFYCRVTADDVPEIVETTFKAGRPVERLLYRDPSTGTAYRSSRVIPFYANQTRLALADCGHAEPEDIEEYVARGGYASLRRAVTELKPEQVCEELTASGLRGRGGAGFPTGRKWLATLRATGSPKYLVCNGDEGDPGAFMDRSLMEGDPHRVLEGAIIAAYASGAAYGYFYIRTEYQLALARMRKAIADARRLGIVGPNLFGSSYAFDCEVVEGAGAFVCGEETALLASIEGERGMPRPKPPFPAESGLFGLPTVVNNVETLATVRWIIEHGAAAFRRYGTPRSPGTKTFALTGKIRNTGLIEVPLGTTLRQIVFEIGGGVPDGRKFKAAQIGGPSGGCLGVEHLDMPLDYETLGQVGAMVGSGGIVILDDSTCIVEVARFFMQFTQHESCGKCVLCREGTRQMLWILQDIVEGRAVPGDIELLEQTARAVKVASLCGLGKSAPNPVLSTLAMFRSEYLAHVERLYCPAGVCSALKTFAIDPDLCKGCTLCLQKCPVGAIQGEKRAPHRIDVALCTKCGVCATVCRFKAIAAR
ncbi:MAG TPA: NADH-quinone oxidoreductase subunit NuoF [Bacillota bacterium]|nr:NADH-quinone oxidoreductase subunit NuoF [Bacillota bacterium]